MIMGHGPLQAQQPTTTRLTGTLARTDYHTIKCELEGETTIESIVEEGTMVQGPTDYRLKAGDTLESIAREHDKSDLSIRQLNEGLGLDWDKLPAGRMIRIPGDLLVELDPLNLKERINSQEISVARSENTLLRAKGNLEVVKLVTALDLKQKEIEYRLAMAALKNFKENEMQTVLEDLQGQVDVAKAKIHGAEKILKLDAKDDPAIQVEIINAQAALLDAQRTLKLAEANLEQFQEHHAPQKITRLELASDLAMVDIEKTKKKKAADLGDAASDISTQEKIMEFEKEKLQNLQEQMANSRIYAPDNGTIVYWSESSRYSRSSSEPIMDGASVRRGQKLIKLPKTDSFNVELSIPQSKRAMVHRGQRAFIMVEGYPNAIIKGVLSMLANTVDTNARSFSNRTGFKGEIQIRNPPDFFHEGMSVRVEIITGNPSSTEGTRRPTTPTAPPNGAGSKSSQKTKTSGRPSASPRTSILMRYDKNKDNKVSATEYGEIPERARQFMGDFKSLDTNRNGFIDKKEETALTEKLRERFRQGGAGGGSDRKASPKKENPEK
jgi:multidrug resistance efflux pump